MSVIVPTVEVEPPPEALLVDDHRHREVLDRVRLGLRIPRQEAPDEHAEVLVELPLGLGRDRVEHDRRLPGARDAGEDRDLALRDAERHVLEVVLAGAADLDVLGHWSLPSLRARAIGRGAGNGIDGRPAAFSSVRPSGVPLPIELLEQRELQARRTLEPRVQRPPGRLRGRGDERGARRQRRAPWQPRHRAPGARPGCDPRRAGRPPPRRRNSAWGGSASSSVARPASRIVTRAPGEVNAAISAMPSTSR